MKIQQERIMTTLTRIGNSQGVRIPKPIIKQAHLEGAQITFEVTRDGLLLRPVHPHHRGQWAAEIDAHLTDQTLDNDPARLQEWLDEPMEAWEW